VIQSISLILCTLTFWWNAAERRGCCDDKKEEEGKLASAGELFVENGRKRRA